ncbi:Metallocarboxypeptidase, M14 family protein [Giardia muris]|uniref:Metallocarboxypeptidase, M14 family protein n=1 Tax=Giardia muris TaxID=5742 RepID=A0A4Z1SN56_GIAMU|nr:Metallocarboxypeptidase, M14 family protein [Giardia muris]|eukprot:TNJ26275.1 Metallocarboxypeptidase, M14 family protein [Giardia muris]
MASLCVVGSFDSGNVGATSISRPAPHPEHQVLYQEIQFSCLSDNEGTSDEAAFKTWFNFVILPTQGDTFPTPLLEFRWTNPPPVKKLLKNFYRPVYRILSRAVGQQLLEAQEAGTRSDLLLPSHSLLPFKYIEQRCVEGEGELVFYLRPPKDAEAIQICYSYPYPLNEVYSRMDGILSATGGERVVLKIVGGGTPVYLYKLYQAPTKPIIYISARCHPGETPGSYILEGLLGGAKQLLDTFQLWVVPAINAEGVRIGNYRANERGYNLNRCYSTAEYPELVTADILRLVAHDLCNPGYETDVPTPLHEALVPILKTRYFEQLGGIRGDNTETKKEEVEEVWPVQRPLPSSGTDLSEDESTPKATVAFEIPLPKKKRTAKSARRVPSRLPRQPSTSSVRAMGTSSSSSTTSDLGLLSRPKVFSSDNLLTSSRSQARPQFVPGPLLKDGEPYSHKTEPKIIFCLDLHSHASIHNCFLFGNSVFDSALPDIPKEKLFLGQIRNILFLNILAGKNQIFDTTKCDFKPDSMTKVDRAGQSFEYTMRVGLYAETTLPTIYCFETHYYRNSKDPTRKLLGPADFVAMGASLAASILEFYSLPFEKVMTHLRRIERSVHLGYSACKLLQELKRSCPDYLALVYGGIYEQVDCQLCGGLRSRSQ